MRAYHYILKRRDVSRAAKNPYRPRGQVKYGPWITVSSHATLDEARAAQRSFINGLYDRGIFHRGRRLTCGTGRFTMYYQREQARAVPDVAEHATDEDAAWLTSPIVGGKL